jgi:hypothetical protein
VFNLKQCEGVEAPPLGEPINPIQKCEEIVSGYKTMPDLRIKAPNQRSCHQVQLANIILSRRYPAQALSLGFTEVTEHCPLADGHGVGNLRDG